MSNRAPELGLGFRIVIIERSIISRVDCQSDTGCLGGAVVRFFICGLDRDFIFVGVVD